MTILTIRTDKPEAEIGLYEDEKQISYETWQAHRQLAETIHKRIEELLSINNKNWQDIKGIVAFRGPGSFTGLRIGLSVANALAFSLDIPAVAENDMPWQINGIKKLKDGQGNKIILPEYGSLPHTTSPKK